MAIMKNWTIGKRLTLGFAGVVLITLCVSFYAFLRLNTIQNEAATLAHDNLPGAVLMGQIAAFSEREIALILAHIKANDAQSIQRLIWSGTNHEKLSTLFKNYGATVFGAEEQSRFERLHTSYLAY